MYYTITVANTIKYLKKINACTLVPGVHNSHPSESQCEVIIHTFNSSRVFTATTAKSNDQLYNWTLVLLREIKNLEES